MNSTGQVIQTQETTLYRNAAAAYGIASLLIVLTAVCLYQPALLFFKQVAANTLYVMFGLLVAGFVFFLVRMDRLMMVSFICCCILCLHLKSTANNQLRLAEVTANPALSISHVNLANAENNYDSVINYMLGLEADFISVQELTPDWTSYLTSRLSAQYPFSHTMTRLDQYGMGFFSKIPFTALDTVFFNDIPSLVCAIELEDKQRCNIMSCQMIPPVNQAAFQTIDRHFNYLADYMTDLEGSYIVLGDLHLPPWASEIQKFRSHCRLQDSRRDINSRNLDGSVSLPRIPVEHIFYCEKFECTSFSELGNDNVGRLGITGVYQLDGESAALVN